MAKPYQPGFIHMDSLDGPSEFFVANTTPKDQDKDMTSAASNDHRLCRAVTMGDNNAPVDFLDTPSAAIDLQLLSKKLLVYVGITLVFYAVFTVVFYIGITVETVNEVIGTSKVAEERVETYNTYSGYIMASVEVFVAMHTDKFMPVLDVYVHNALFFLQRARGSSTIQPASKVSRRLHTLLLVLFPIVLGLTMGNSLRGLQAAHSSVGFKHIMSASDLKKEQSMLEMLKVKASAGKNVTTAMATANVRGVKDSILKNAIREESTPFAFNTKSACGDKTNASEAGKDDGLTNAISSSLKAQRMVQLNVHELDSTSVVYGFNPQEWNGEAIPFELTPTSTYTITYQQVLNAKKANDTKKNAIAEPSDFSIATAYEMLVQAKLLIERAQGDTMTDSYPCSLSDSREEWDTGAVTSSGSGSAGVDVGTTAKPNNSTAKPNNTTAKPNNATAKPNNATSKPNNTTPKPNTATPKPTNATAKPKAVAMKNGPGSLVSRFHKVAMRRLQEDLEEQEQEEDSVDDSKNQWTYDEDGVRQCQGAVSSLFDMGSFYSRDKFTAEDLVVETAAVIAKTLPNVSIEETEIVLEKYDLTPQIHLETMRIDIPIAKTVSYGLNSGCSAEDAAKDKCDPIYSYEGLQESFCGSQGCAFLDSSKTFLIQREIGVVPYVTNCSLDIKNVHYSADFRGFYPSDCQKLANTALLYGFGSYISGDEYGSNDTKPDSGAPYIIAPRRRLRFTVAKVTWKTENLAASFNASCGTDAHKANCTGLWYQLQPSGRFLFAGEDALPSKKLARTDFRSPIPLVQLNSPTLFVDAFKEQVTLERLSPKYFTTTKWNGTQALNGSALSGDDCSMLIDSYLKQVETNNFYLERPLHAMYTSFFYYLMENAAVTQLNDTSLVALNGSSTTTSANKTGAPVAATMLATDRLGNVKLKGDMQVRSIRVSVPTSSFFTTMGGCVVVFILTVLILAVPARRVEQFDDDATRAEVFEAMRNDEQYPDSVHTKTLLFPATNESVPFDDVQVERMALVHETEKGRMLYL